MAYIESGGFIFNVPSVLNGISPAFFSNCVPVSVGVGERVPVRVRVSVGVSVGQSNQIQQPQLQQQIAITAQQVSLMLPVVQGISNPVRQHQTNNLRQEQQIGVIEPVNDELREFVRNFGDAAVKIYAASQNKSQALETLRSLASEVAVVNQTRLDLVDEAVKTSAQATQSLYAKLRSMPTQAVRETLQKALVNWDDIQTITQNLQVGDAGKQIVVEALEKISQANPSQLQTIQRQVLETVNRTVAQACSI